MAESPRWRVGTVPYLVARPLTDGLEEDPRIDLTVAPPAELARGLRSGELDVALASSVLRLDEPPLAMWEEGPVIAGDGPIRSVLLFLAPGVESPSRIRRWYADPDSRTGRMLTSWLLEHAWDAPEATMLEAPEVEDLRQAALDAGMDAVQLIGDPALVARRSWHRWTVVDLGQAWATATDLPFLYAGWMLRPGFELGELAGILEEAAVRGLAARPQLAASAAEGDDDREVFLRRYLTEDLRYRLDPGTAAAILRRLTASPRELPTVPRGETGRDGS